MEIQLRDATERDLSAILAILNYEIENTTAVYDESPKSENEIRRWFEEKGKMHFPIIVAEIDNVILGYGTYGIFRPWEAFRKSVEHSVYVSNKSRGKGIGKALLQALIKKAKAENYHTLIAGIDAENKSSLIFHEKMGFEKAGHLKEAGYKFDRWLDLVFMQLML